ncbi:MAG: DUF523 domain-containing protein [Alcanivoracaceae bacterium]|nr:DUF523 domain-containing protein [Alcanivoracaceae bacterium]
MIKLAVSACLLGKNVRYDGGHKFVNLTEYFNPDTYQLIGICPEVEMGMPIPRDPIQIINDDNHISLTQVKNNKVDYSEQMKRWFHENNHDFNQYAGYILKSKSPSCGNQTTPHFLASQELFLADGFFVCLLKIHYPYVAIIDENSLDNPKSLYEFTNKLKKTLP